MRAIFQGRRDIIVEGLAAVGIKVPKPLATFYIWARVPAGYTSAEFAEALIEKAGIVVTPGSGFGDAGEGYFRISLTAPDERLQEAIRRLKTLNL